MIEERRKKREAIKSKHKSEATPIQMDALALDNVFAAAAPEQRTPEGHPKPPGKTCAYGPYLVL